MKLTKNYCAILPPAVALYMDILNTIFFYLTILLVIIFIAKLVASLFKKPPKPTISRKFLIITLLFLINCAVYVKFQFESDPDLYYISYLVLGGLLISAYFLLAKLTRKITRYFLLIAGIIFIIAGIASFLKIQQRNAKPSINQTADSGLLPLDSGCNQTFF